MSDKVHADRQHAGGGHVGGIIHTYQRYDPQHFPSPTAPPPDLVSGAMQHMLYYGGRRRLTPEEMARAVKIDPSQIAGLGPSIEALLEMLRQRKAKILATYETDTVRPKRTSVTASWPLPCTRPKRCGASSSR